MATDSELPEIIAHRGNAGEWPENTLQSLQSAVDLGVRHIEFDVQLTQDEVPVLLHDADFRRVGGRPECVHDLSWSAFSAIRVGEVERLGTQHALTFAPSLAQTVQALATWTEVTAFVEIKRASLRRFGRETVLQRIADTLEPVSDRCVLISFDLTSMQIFRTITGTRIGWVLENYDAASRAAAERLAPEFLFCNLERVPSDTIALWTGPWDWAMYEVRDVRTARACAEIGARFVESMTVRGLLAGYGTSSGS